MRALKGSLYVSRGFWYVAFKLDRRRHFRLSSTTREQAELKQEVLAHVVNRVRQAASVGLTVRIAKEVARLEGSALAKVLVIANGVADGTEQPDAPGSLPSGTTFGEMAELWTSGELSRRFRNRVKAIDHTENRRRLRKHILDVVYEGRSIRDTPLTEFALDHADFVLSQGSIPDGSVRHIATIMNRVLRLAVTPAKLLKSSPIPPGWLPPANSPKERTYLLPEEEAQLLRCTSIPLVRRLFFGVCAREGLRRANAVTLRWGNLHLDHESGAASVALDHTKNGRGGSWRLDNGTAEALRRWKRTCPSDELVFPTEALPGHKRRRKGQPMYVGKIAEDLRLALHAAKVDRHQIFQNDQYRQRLRAHDLRATFVTLSLACGQTEDWVTQRTGHTTSAMMGRYRRAARTAEELDLGWLRPLHEAIPELSDMDSAEGSVGKVSAADK